MRYNCPRIALGHELPPGSSPTILMTLVPETGFSLQKRTLRSPNRHPDGASDTEGRHSLLYAPAVQ